MAIIAAGIYYGTHLPCLTPQAENFYHIKFIAPHYLVGVFGCLIWHVKYDNILKSVIIAMII